MTVWLNEQDSVLVIKYLKAEFSNNYKTTWRLRFRAPTKVDNIQIDPNGVKNSTALDYIEKSRKKNKKIEIVYIPGQSDPYYKGRYLDAIDNDERYIRFIIWISHGYRTVVIKRINEVIKRYPVIKSQFWPFLTTYNIIQFWLRKTIFNYVQCNSFQYDL